MADLAKFGVEIDPRGAVQGAKRVEQSLDFIGRAAQRTQNKVDRSFRRQGRSARRAGRTTKRSFGDMTNGIIELLDGIGLLNNGFGAMIRRGQNLSQATSRLGGNFGAVAAGATAAGAGLSNASKGIDGVGDASVSAGRGLKGLLPILAAVAAAVLVVVAAFKALGFAFRSIKAGIRIAADLESATTGLEVLLGTTSGAQARINELAEFSAKTPFQLPDIIEANRKMQIFTKGALATSEGLTLIGDAAAGVQKPLNEVSEWVGRLYAGLKGGTPIGEATAELMRMGIIAPDTKNQLEALSKSANENGKAFDQLWALAVRDMEQFSESMDRQSQTWNGLVSTLKDNWNLLRADIGAPIKDALKPVLIDLINFIQGAREEAKALGVFLAGVFRTIREAVAGGELLKLLGLTFMAGAETFLSAMLTATGKFIDFVGAGLTSVFEWAGNNLGEAMRKAFHNAIEFFKKIMKPVVEVLEDVIGKAQDAAQRITGNASLAANPNKLSFQLGPKDFIPLPEEQLRLGSLIEKNRSTAAEDLLGGLVGTEFRDAAGKLSSDLQFRGIQREEFKPIEEIKTPFEAAPLPAKEKKGKDPTERFKDALKAMGDLRTQMDEFSADTLTNFSNSVGEAFSSIALGAKDAKTAFVDMANAIISQIVRMIIQMTIQLALSRALGLNTGGAGAGIVGAIAGLPTQHSGGKAGGVGVGSSGLGRYDSGGISSSEAAIKVDRNETVLTRRRSEELEMELSEKRGRSEKGGNQQAVQIVNVVDPAMVSDALAANPDAVVNALGRRPSALRQMVVRGGGNV